MRPIECSRSKCEVINREKWKNRSVFIIFPPRTIFLNDKLLTLINNTVPEMSPKILNDTKHGVDLRLQSGSIGFWIIPNLKVHISLSKRCSLYK